MLKDVTLQLFIKVSKRSKSFREAFFLSEDGMQFLSREHYIACLSQETYGECVTLFWQIMLDINVGWSNSPSVVTTKKEWDNAFRSIDGVPYVRTRNKASHPDKAAEVKILIRGLEQKPRHSVSWHPTELLVYPFVVPLWAGKYKSPKSRKKVTENYLLYLCEIRYLIKHRRSILHYRQEESWLRRFDNREQKYHDLDRMVEEARRTLVRLEVLSTRAELRGK